MESGAVRNAILAGLPAADWAALHADAEFVTYPAGTTLMQPGDRISSLFFPTSGIVSVVSSLASGESLEIATVGADGFIGIGHILQMQSSPYLYTVRSVSSGYQIAAEPFERTFATSDAVRRVTLAYIGRVVKRAERAALCNRFHPQDQRLARWLLTRADKSGERSLPLTHDLIAHMVGGPRHAVTAALNKLRELGAIEYVRGRIDIVDHELLATAACQCYRTPR